MQIKLSNIRMSGYLKITMILLLKEKKKNPVIPDKSLSKLKILEFCKEKSIVY